MKKDRAPFDVDLVVYVDGDDIDVHNVDRYVGAMGSAGYHRVDADRLHAQVAQLQAGQIGLTTPAETNSDIRIFLSHNDADHVTLVEAKQFVQGSFKLPHHGVRPADGLYCEARPIDHQTQHRTQSECRKAPGTHVGVHGLQVSEFERL